MEFCAAEFFRLSRSASSGVAEETDARVAIIIIIIIINRDLKSLPVIKHRSRLYNDGKKEEKKSEKICVALSASEGGRRSVSMEPCVSSCVTFCLLPSVPGSLRSERE